MKMKQKKIKIVQTKDKIELQRNIRSDFQGTPPSAL